MRYLFVTLCFFVCYTGFCSTKTAPEFTVVIDTDNFKEIRIPFKLWKDIVTRNYKPSSKAPLSTNIRDKQGNQIENGSETDPTGISSTYMSSPILHEVVLNVIVPPESDANSENPSADATISTQEVMLPSLDEVPVNKPQKPVKAKPEKPNAEAVVETAADEVGVGVPTSPESVLVQTTRAPCTCTGGICGCCATFFFQKGCANVGFNPEEFAFEVKMTMNGNVIATRKLPVADPPPICFNPRRAPFLEVCAQLSKIHFKNNNVHACVDLDANIGGFELFSWNFNCLRFGAQGLVTGINPEKIKKPASKPENTGIFGLFGGGGGDDEDEDGDILDEILDGDF